MANLNRTDIKVYTARKQALIRMGLNGYQQYLRSDLWSEIRQRVLVEHGSICKLCPRLARNVHHLSYDENTLRGLTLELLVPLCSRCHRKVELKEDGTKRTYLGARRTYYRLLEEYTFEAPVPPKISKTVTRPRRNVRRRADRG